MMNITASQIRQDLNCFGGFGQQGYGYNVRYLYHKIGEILGVDNKYTAVIIGAGHLGGAIAGSTMFEKRGMMLVGIFDSDPRVIGRNLSGQKVKDIAQIDYFLGEIHVDVAILTLPKEKTNEMAQRLAAGGVRGFWNFTNAQIDRSKYNIIVENVHMGDSLMQLMYELTLTAPKKDDTPQEEETTFDGPGCDRMDQKDDDWHHRKKRIEMTLEFQYGRGCVVCRSGWRSILHKRPERHVGLCCIWLPIPACAAGLSANTKRLQRRWA